MHLRDRTLVVPPFRVERHGQAYTSGAELEIDLAGVRPGRYRVLAVQNFHVEDTNPNLDECVAGVFLAGARGDRRWEEPEAFPVECRKLALLAHLEVGARLRVVPAGAGVLLA
jgi:hypothetical protein